MTIKDGTGSGYEASVNSFHLLAVNSVSRSIQQWISSERGDAYQALGTVSLSAATLPVIWLQNDDPDRNMVITYIRMQLVGPTGGTSLPVSTNYFRIGLGRTYSSGGSAVTPVNLNTGSGNEASITAYHNGPTLTGTIKEFDRWYPSNSDMITFNKEGSIVIPQGGSIEVDYIGDHTGGIAYARVSFLMFPKVF